MAIVKNIGAEKNIANIKVLLESYGIGVRAGVITPCLQDENDFRRILGLKAAPVEVESAWQENKGVRVPTTLKVSSGTVLEEGEELL